MRRPPRHATVLERLAWRAAEEPDGSACVFESRAYSYGELWEEIRRFAGLVRELEVAPGARIVVAVPNGPEFFTAFYGALAAGAIAVPIFPGSGAGRLVDVAGRCGARTVVTSSATLTVELAARSDLRILAPGDASAVTPSSAPPAPDPRAVAYIQYTSGSTGEPKGVQVTHAAIVANLEQMIAGMGITPREIFVSWLPVHHDMGLVLMTMVPFYLGAGLILLPASLRSVGPWLARIGEHRGTFTAAPDFAYRLCLRHADRREYDLSSLRVALNAAEPVRPGTVARFHRLFELEHVMVPGYGLAEATVGVTMCRPGTPAKIDDRGFPAVGAGFPGVELAILGKSGTQPPGEVGEILVKSPANTPGYWDDPEATEELFWSGGYLRTGDLGYLDEDGDLFVVGRTKNIIIQAGRNIAPAEVEGVVDAFRFVRRSAAVGIDRGGREGEQIFVFAEMRKAAVPKPEVCRRRVIEVTRALRSHLGLGPGRVYLVPPRAIPLTHNGKVRHAELRSRYLDGSLRECGLLVFPDY